MSSGQRRRQRSNGRRPREKYSARRINNLSDEQLLSLRICDLALQIAGTPLEERIESLYYELEMKGITFRPHCWLSDEWFTADGVPGIAIPFYLAHPRLMRLERKQMLEVEGGSEEWCLRILRHEAGHAIDNAYRLRHRRSWQRMFGKSTQPYPDHYSPKPYSRRFVLHLDLWYAQSHPAEDFAETFAVWLKPKSRWRSQYQGWSALKKLEYVDTVMQEIRETKPLVRSRVRPDSVSRLRKTLQEYYDQKRAHYGLDHPNFYDQDLRRLFSDAPEHARRPSAASFLEKVGVDLRREVARWTGEYQYTINEVLAEMIRRCRKLKLRVHRPKKEVERDALVLLTVQTMNYLHDGRHRVAL